MILYYYDLSVQKNRKVNTTKPIYINPDQISTITPNGEYGSIITMANGKTITVVEKFMEIVGSKNTTIATPKKENVNYEN